MCVTQFPKRSILHSTCARIYNIYCVTTYTLCNEICSLTDTARTKLRAKRRRANVDFEHHGSKRNLEEAWWLARWKRAREGEKIGRKPGTHTHAGNSRNPAQYRAAAIPGRRGDEGGGGERERERVSFSRDVARNLEILSNWIISLRGNRARIAAGDKPGLRCADYHNSGNSGVVPRQRGGRVSLSFCHSPATEMNSEKPTLASNRCSRREGRLVEFGVAIRLRFEIRFHDRGFRSHLPERKDSPKMEFSFFSSRTYVASEITRWRRFDTNRVFVVDSVLGFSRHFVIAVLYLLLLFYLLF